MAVALARRPGPFVTAVMPTEAEQTAAFRQLRNPNVSPEDLEAAIGESTARSLASESTILVPIDGSSIAIRDADGRKGAGAQNTRSHTGSGFKVMSAVALTLGAVAIGLLAQFWWVRPRRVRKRTSRQKVNERRRKSVFEKESGHWFRVIEMVRARLSALAPRCTAWFLMDRGADIAQLLEYSIQQKLLVTVRLAHERRAVGAKHRTQLDCVRASRPVGQYELQVPASRERACRTAKMKVRACRVTIGCPRQSNRSFAINVVHTREVGTTPRGEKPIEWFLYTTAEINTLKACIAVINAYASRWSIEEFHNSWKSGGTRVERTQLRSKPAILKWATLLAAVSIRALRLAKLGRETPDVPATTEFNRHEIESAILLRKPKGISIRHVPTMQQMVRWVADIGGYAGSRAKYPPGKIVILRGLLEVEAAARALEQRERMKK